MPSSNLPFIGILLTSGISLVLGLLAWWRDRQRDVTTEEAAAQAGRVAAKDVATKASESAVRVVQQALDVAAKQIAQLTTLADQLPALRREIDQLREDHEICEERNRALTTRVQELEMMAR